MLKLNIKNIESLSFKEKKEILSEFNAIIENYSVEERISWSLENLPGTHILSSSFGIQSIVLLHLMIKQKPNIPIVLIDTGYLFPQTYIFIDLLTEKFDLNLKVFRSNISPAWQEARYGKLWEKGLEGINFYNNINKVEPMHVALKTLAVQTWFAGLRRAQSKSRSSLHYLSIHKSTFKVLPILDWSDEKTDEYLKVHNLNVHPLSKDGYVSVGDIHTTEKYRTSILKEQTRFFGLKRECGLHEN